MGKYENLSDGDMSHRNWWREVARAVQDIDARLIAIEAAQPEKPNLLEPGWYLVRWVNGTSYGVGQLDFYGKWSNASGFGQAAPIVVDQPIKKPRIPEPKE